MIEPKNQAKQSAAELDRSAPEDRARQQPLKRDPSPVDQQSWDRGAGRRFASLAVSRGFVQVLRLVWFVLAVRLLPESGLGEVATGLVFFAIFAGIGDLGTTKTVVRLVSANSDLLWPIVRAALWRRIAGGLVSGALVVAGLAMADAAVRPVVVALAALAATASGCTEISFAALRTIAHSRTEQIVLISERIAFIVVAVGLIQIGGGSVAILTLYLATNIVSGLGTSIVVLRQRSTAPARAVPSLWDAEARRTALAFALFTVTPRVSPAVLAFLVAPAVVAEFSVAYRPAEGLALFALAAGVPLLPILRSHVLSNRQGAIERSTASVISVLGAALIPFVVVFIGWPELIIRILTGGEVYGSANQTLTILGFTVFTWNFRGVGESLLYAQERANAVVTMTLIGLVVTLVVSVPSIMRWGAPGAAGAVLVGEVIMVGYLLAASAELRSAPVRSVGARLLLLMAPAMCVLPLTSELTMRVAVLAVTAAAAAAYALAGVRQLDLAIVEDSDD